MDPSQVTELALRLGWLERLELAQRLLSSLHPQAEESSPLVEKPGYRQSIKLPDPVPQLVQPPQAKSVKLDSVATSFQKLRDALESSLES